MLGELVILLAELVVPFRAAEWDFFHQLSHALQPSGFSHGPSQAFVPMEEADTDGTMWVDQGERHEDRDDAARNEPDAGGWILDESAAGARDICCSGGSLRAGPSTSEPAASGAASPQAGGSCGSPCGQPFRGRLPG
jgi:hypothetical protein